MWRQSVGPPPSLGGAAIWPLPGPPLSLLVGGSAT
jgi:hypothetical protein